MIKNNQKPARFVLQSKTGGYVIGIDGGGTKTVAALSNLEGKILLKKEIGPSNPNKVGIKKALFNLTLSINKVLKGLSKDYNPPTTSSHRLRRWAPNIKFVYIGLAGGLERDKEKKKEIEKEILKSFPEFLKKLKVEGDQKAAFYSGTNQKEGVVLISGTGSIAMGWKGKKEEISGGWDWLLGDQGSGFWIGKRALEIICKELDRRGPKTQHLRKLIFQKWKIKKDSDLIRKVYQKDFVEIVADLANLVEKAEKKKDKIARDLLIEAGKELALAANLVIKKLNFQKIKFPVVLVGSVFKSKVVLDTVKKEIKKFAPKAQFIRLKVEPVVGAIKLAIEQVKTK